MSYNNQTHWDLLTTLMEEGFYVLQDHCFVYMNPALEKLLGIEPSQLVGQRFEQIVAPDQRDRALKNYENRLQGLPSPVHYEITLQRLDNGDPIEVWLEVKKVEEDGRIIIAGTIRDIGSFKNLKKELEQTKSQLHSILENTPDTLYQTDMQGFVTLISGNVEALLGYTKQEMTGSRLADYYWSPEEREKVVQAIVDNDGVITNVEAILRRKDGEPVWISTNAYVKKDDGGNPLSIEGLARDITLQKEMEQKLERLALTDSLTNLPNRRALMDELHGHFTEAQTSGKALSVIYFDINDFKKINDGHGHLAGDNVLRHIALTLRSHASQRKMFGRLSGDEFLFILPGFSADKTVKFVQTILADIKRKPLIMGDLEIPLSMAIGISALHQADKNEFSLLDRADKGMYLAKKKRIHYEVI